MSGLRDVINIKIGIDYDNNMRYFLKGKNYLMENIGKDEVCGF